jgi:hypothetical protein
LVVPIFIVLLPTSLIETVRCDRFAISCRVVCLPQLISVLIFTCSCLVSYFPSEVGQFNLECCPLVQEINSVIHYLPCFGGGLLLCLFTESSALGVYFFSPLFFSRAGSVFYPPLSCLCFITVHSLFFSFAG